MRILVAGWFSFEEMGATAGDLLARDLLCDWLRGAGLPHDVALAEPFQGGFDWRTVNPADYTHVVFVCGPFGNGEPITEFLSAFGGCRLVGLNLSMLEPLEHWDPFDLLLERDSSAGARPDITFLARQDLVPVVGLVLVHQQTEYKGRARHEAAESAIRRLLTAREASTIPIDTRLDVNAAGLRTPAEVESIIARMDVVVTTRLHGLVLAIRNNVPALAIDPIAGGAKILRQAQTIGWPVVFTADALSDAGLLKAFDYCLTPEARTQAAQCRERARTMVEETGRQLLSFLRRDKSRAET